MGEAQVVECPPRSPRPRGARSGYSPRLWRDVYGQLKGFSTWSWRKRWPDKPFGWSDGVYAVTVDPENCQGLRNYIRNQHAHHGDGTTVPHWEPEDSP
ncbi:MAG: hypothetical protein GY854_06410 [Deltaproteobacteria bacterium]|nr:hypothetical protein [Deltaproteobacteria bacterium]